MSSWFLYSRFLEDILVFWIHLPNWFRTIWNWIKSNQINFILFISKSRCVFGTRKNKNINKFAESDADNNEWGDYKILSEFGKQMEGQRSLDDQIKSIWHSISYSFWTFWVIWNLIITREKNDNFSENFLKIAFWPNYPIISITLRININRNMIPLTWFLGFVGSRKLPNLSKNDETVDNCFMEILIE